MCDKVCIEVNETVENISIEVRDFSVLNIISEDADNSAKIGSDGLLFVPESAGVTKHSELTLDDGRNPHGTTKSDVGLSNVDNTSDIDKPISTATQQALDSKLDKSTTPSSVYGTDASGEQTMIPLDSLGGDSETFNQSTWMFSDFYSDSVYQPPFTGGAIAGGTKNTEVYSDTDKNDYVGSHLLYSASTANSGYRYLNSTIPNDCGMYAKPNFCSFFQFKIIGIANDRVIRIGFHNAVNSSVPTHGAYLEILGNTAYFKTRSNSIETSSSSVILNGGAVRNGVYYKLLIEFISTTSVNCKLVDNSGNVVLNVNHTTNVPTSTQVFGCGLIAINTVAAPGQLMSIDYMGVGRQKPNFLNNF